MLSRSGLYALQAALHLAQRQSDVPVSAAQMARELELPPDYLAKVLARLRSAGLVRSTRGKRGGYRLIATPEEVTVEDVVHPFEEVRILKRCLLGGACDTENPCAAHLQRLEWNEARSRILAATRLVDLLPGPGEDGHPAPNPNDSNDRT